MEPFATVEDYEDRYGVVDDPSRVETLLADASAFIAGQPGFALAEGDEAQAAFVRQFKRQKGLTPTAYRDAWRKEHE